jgi:hypothetical protein
MMLNTKSRNGSLIGGSGETAELETAEGQGSISLPIMGDNGPTV